jgi:TonB family protein
MLALILIAWVSAGHSLQGVTEKAQTPPPKLVAPAPERRLFNLRSRQAWDVVQKRLNELGFSPEKTDRPNQVVLTKWREVGAKGLEWLPTPAVTETYVARRIRFEVFVSPFAEPAHVYIGSVIEGVQVGLQTSAPAIGYNDSNLNRALMREIAKALGEDGLPIPADFGERRQLARSILKEEADDCLRQGPPSAEGAKVTPPRKIPLSEFKFFYPAAAMKEKTEGTVRVEFVILEDGGVTDLRVLDAVLGNQLDILAMGVVSLLFYSPTKLNECNVPAFLTYSVHYKFP